MAKIPKLIVQVAINGTDTVPSQSPYIPITPDEVAEECYKCWRAGAAMVHLHARDPKDGSPTRSLDIWEEILTKTQKKCGDLILGCTSGGAYGLTPSERLSVVTRFKPEIASLNPESVSNTLHHIVPRIKEFKYEWEKAYLMRTYNHAFVNTFEDLEAFAKAMRECGTKPECEIFSTSGLYNIRWLHREGLLDQPICMQFVLGILGGTGAYPWEVVHMESDALHMFGENNFVWFVVGVGYPRQYTLGALAMAMFGHVRVGMEDNLYCRQNVLCKSNVQMVEDIKIIAEIFGRELASPDETRQILSLKGKEKVNF